MFRTSFCFDFSLFLIGTCLIHVQIVALKEDGCPRVWVVTSDSCQQQAAHGAVSNCVARGNNFIQYKLGRNSSNFLSCLG